MGKSSEKSSCVIFPWQRFAAPTVPTSFSFQRNLRRSIPVFFLRCASQALRCSAGIYDLLFVFLFVLNFFSFLFDLVPITFVHYNVLTTFVFFSGWMIWIILMILAGKVTERMTLRWLIYWFNCGLSFENWMGKEYKE